MGSGKTTLGSRLAAALQIPFVDLDARIETAAGRPIHEIFAFEAEAGFRRREAAALAALVTGAPARCIVATGGGVVELATASSRLHALGRIVWLRADPDVCVARLGAERGTRPLLEADWRSRWERRAPLYAGLADAIVDTDQGVIETSLAALHAVWNAGRAPGA